MAPNPLTQEQMDENRRNATEDSMIREMEIKFHVVNALSAQKLQEQAEAAGKWIYDPKSKKWYTPQEFYNEFKLYFLDHPFFHQVKVLHPNEGITAGFKQLSDLHKRLMEFTNKVVSYYKK